MFGGGAGLWRYPEGSPHSLSEGAVVAGAIILFVDPLLKKRLLKEFARDLFPYMIGFDLPVQIKDRLREMVSDTKLYRRDMTMICTFSGKDDDVKIDFKTAFTLVNPTPRALTYRHHLAFEEAERSQLVAVTFPDGGHEDKQKLVCLEKRQSGLYDYDSDEFHVEPGKEYGFSSQYAQQNGWPGFHLQTFHLPTINFTLTLHTDRDDLEVIATPPVAHKELGFRALMPDTPLIYHQLFMGGDSINIRWRQRRH
jgi:hypothetical protein